MKSYARILGELLLFALLAGFLLVAVIVITQQIFDDDKAQYFVIGYYVANHNDLALWIWKRLRIEKTQDSDEEKKAGR